MSWLDYEYEVVGPSPDQRGAVSSGTELAGRLPVKQPLYRSYYGFPEGSLQPRRDRRSPINDYDGDYYIPEIVLDVDGDNALTATREVIRQLITGFDVPDEYVHPYFSGTGFHIHIPDLFAFEASKQLPAIARATIAEVFGSNVDSKPLNPKGLIRVPNSINKKSDLYKIPLKLDEVLNQDLSYIRDIATDPRHLDWNTLESSKPVLASLKTDKQPRSHHENEEVSDYVTEGVPQRIQTAAKAYVQGVEEGNRHDSMMAIASAWRLAGVPRQAAIEALVPWANRENRSATRPISRDEVEDVVNDVYQTPRTFSLDHPVMQYLNEDKNLDIADADAMAEEFREIIGNRDKSINLQSYWPIISDPFYVNAGDVVTLLGATGLGKSTLCQNILALTKQQRVLHLTLENSRQLTYRRYVQIDQGIGKDEAIDRILAGDHSVHQRVKHIAVKDTTLDIDELPSVVGLMEPDIVFVDTVDKILCGRVTDLVTKIYRVFPKIKDIAKATQTIIMVVSHINRSSALRGETGIYSGVGGGAIEQNSDVVLSINGNRRSPKRTVAVEKARDQDPFTLLFEFDFDKTFRFLPKAKRSGTMNLNSNNV